MQTRYIIIIIVGIDHNTTTRWYNCEAQSDTVDISLGTNYKF